MKSVFWNLISKYGAILGVILALSSVAEPMMITAGYIYSGAFVWVAVFVLHLYLLHRFTKQYSNSFSKDDGFSFGTGYGFIVLVSLFAGIIVGLANYIYTNIIIGYENQVDSMIATMEKILSMNEGSMPASIEPMFYQYVNELQNVVEPSIIDTVWGGALGGAFFGAIFGLVIAGINSRSPQPFEDTTIK